MERQIIEIDEEKCTGCGNCVIACAEGAIEIRDGKAKVIKDSFCDGLGACIGECPEGALAIVTREAEPFDEEAVQAHLAEMAQRHQQAQSAREAGCPGARAFKLPIAECAPAEPNEDTGSWLQNWPIQIRLLPAKAPFFRRAHLLVAGDCVAFAWRNFQDDLLRGKVLAVGCPKLDANEAQVEKLAQIIGENEIDAITVAHMEVPCCNGLLHVVRQALAASGKDIPLESIEVSVRGAPGEKRPG